MLKVINVVSDTNIGGAGKCVLIFLKHFNREKFYVKAVIPTNSLLKPEIENLNIESVEIDGMADKSLGLKGIMNLYKYFKKEKPHIVHTHASMSARIAAKFAGVPGVIYTRHSVFPPKPFMTKGIGKVINRFMNHTFSDQIIAVAEAAKGNLTDTGIADERVIVLQNGVDYLEPLDKEKKIRLRQQYGLEENDFIAAIAARLTRVKGHKYLIEAIKITFEKNPNIKLLIVGTGEEEASLKQQVKDLNLEDNVIFTGFVKDVTGITNIMDIGVNASFGTEATSLALLEGMSLGRPAVVTEFGGNPGVITHGENGFLVPIKNSAKLAEYILKIAEDDKLREYMQNKSREIFDKKFTSEVYTRNIEVVYEEVASREGGKSYGAGR